MFLRVGSWMSWKPWRNWGVLGARCDGSDLERLGKDWIGIVFQIGELIEVSKMMNQMWEGGPIGEIGWLRWIRAIWRGSSEESDDGCCKRDTEEVDDCIDISAERVNENWRIPSIVTRGQRKSEKESDSSGIRRNTILCERRKDYGIRGRETEDLNTERGERSGRKMWIPGRRW